MKEKKICQGRFYWNPDTKEKIMTHYEIWEEVSGRMVLTGFEEIPNLDKDKCKAASEACSRQSMKIIQEDVNARKKPIEKRLVDRPEMVEEITKKIEEVKKFDNKKSKKFIE